MEKTIKIREFQEKARELLLTEASESMIRLVIDYFVLLMESFSIEEKVEAAITNEGFMEIELLLRHQLKVLDEYDDYFQRQKKVFDEKLDRIQNPDNYQIGVADRMSLSEKQLSLMLSALTEEFIPLAKMPA